MTLSDGLTNRVYDFIYQYNAEHGLPPTYAKIADGMDLTISAVRRQLDILEAKGKIYREENSKPAIRLMNGKT